MQRLAPLSAKWQRLRSETRDAASSWLFSPLARTDDPGIVETRALERDASTQWHLWQRLGTIEEIPQLTRLLAGAVFTSLVVPLSGGRNVRETHGERSAEAAALLGLAEGDQPQPRNRSKQQRHRVAARGPARVARAVQGHGGL